MYRRPFWGLCCVLLGLAGCGIFSGRVGGSSWGSAAIGRAYARPFFCAGIFQPCKYCGGICGRVCFDRVSIPGGGVLSWRIVAVAFWALGSCPGELLPSSFEPWRQVSRLRVPGARPSRGSRAVISTLRNLGSSNLSAQIPAHRF